MNTHGLAETSIVGTPEREVALALRRAERPLLLLGYGTVLSEAHVEVAQMARRLSHLRVAATPKAKGAFAEEHAQYLGVVGFAGHDAANQFLFEQADFVLVVGTRLGELTSNNWDARWQKLQMARVDVSAASLASWCTSKITLRSDAKRALTNVLVHLPQRVGVVPTVAATTTVATLPPPERSTDGDAGTEAELTPRRVFEVLNRVYHPDGHVFSGIGNTMAWGIHYLRRSVANRWHVNLAAGAMGHAIPAAMGAGLTGARAIAVVGDAEFLMTGYELHTAVENAIPLTIVVLNDAGHGMVRVGSRVHCQGKTPGFDFQTPVDVVLACRAQGAYATRATTLAHFEHELSLIDGRRGPTVIDVPISRDLMPPLGARLTSLSQAFGSHRCEDTDA